MSNDKLVVLNPTIKRTVIMQNSAVQSIQTGTNNPGSVGLNLPTQNKENTSTPVTVKHIGKVKDKILVAMDNGIYYRIPLNKLDIPSFSTINSVITDVTPKDGKILIAYHNQLTGVKTEKEVELGNASFTSIGMVRFATESEALAGTITNAVLTPKTSLLQIKKVLENSDNIVEATNTKKGIVRLASVTEALSNTGSEVLTSETGTALIKQEMKKTNNLPVASESSIGNVKLSTKLLGNDGTTVLGYLVNVEE